MGTFDPEMDADWVHANTDGTVYDVDGLLQMLGRLECSPAEIGPRAFCDFLVDVNGNFYKAELVRSIRWLCVASFFFRGAPHTFFLGDSCRAMFQRDDGRCVGKPKVQFFYAPGEFFSCGVFCRAKIDGATELGWKNHARLAHLFYAGDTRDTRGSRSTWGHPKSGGRVAWAFV